MQAPLNPALIYFLLLLPMQSALERCLQQVVVVHRQLLEVNGGGEPLLLSDFLFGE